jgi:methylthioribose-1-phosphate isomerase
MDTPDVLTWRDGHIEALDQTVLPHQVRVLRITTVDQLIEAITTLAVRGAPVLGVAGALGVALAVGQGDREGWDRARLDARSNASPTPGRRPSTSAARCSSPRSGYRRAVTPSRRRRWRWPGSPTR